MKTKNFLLSVFIFCSVTSSQSLQWTYTHNNNNWNHNVPANMNVDGSGNILITGRKSSGNEDYFTVKISPLGSLIWERSYTGAQGLDDVSLSVITDNDGNVYVTGYTREISGQAKDITTLKYSSTGSLLWSRNYNGPANLDDEGKSIVTDNAGNIIVAGTSYGSGSQSDYIVLKYSPSGTLIWSYRYNGPANSYDELTDMKIDASGNIIATGTSIGIGTGQDYATIKVSGSSGTLLWERRYNNPETGNNPDIATALDVNTSGDVFVTGRSNSTNGGWDFLTQKYDASGSPQWTQRFNGTNNGWDEPGSIQADLSGNLFVAGFTRNNSSQDISVVIKYNLAGNVLWTKFHQETPLTTEKPKSLDVDINGNAYVTVFTDDGWGNIINIKLNGLNGDIMWQHNYQTGQYNDPVSIVLDNNHNILVAARTGSRSTVIKYSNTVDLNNNNSSVEGFSLGQNYPNPFNPSTKIGFSISKNSFVKLYVYDVTGKIITKLIDENLNKGSYDVIFYADKISSGTYFYRLDADGYSEVKKMIFIK